MRRVWFSAVVIAAARRSLATAARTGETTRPNDAGGYTGTERKLESSSDGSGQGEKVVVSGVLELLSTTARGACNLSCTGGIAAAFGTEEDSVACVCPHDANSTRRLHETLRSFERVLLLSPGSPEETSPLPVRHLRGLVELEESAKAAFAVRIQDVSDGGADALGQLSTTGLREVASTFGVQESEVEFSTLTVSPPPSSDVALAAVAENPDASDVEVLRQRAGPSYMGGTKGVDLFLSLLVLWAGTLFCGLSCICAALMCPNRNRKDRSKQQLSPVPKKGYKPTTELDQHPYPPPAAGYAQESSSPVEEKTRSASHHQFLKSAVPPSAPYAEGDAAAGGSSDRLSVPVTNPTKYTSGLSSSMTSPLPTRGGKVGGGASVRDDAGAMHVRKTSMNMVPLNRSQGTRDFTTQGDVTPKSAGTPSRLRGIGSFLGNATPARLRRLAGRMSVISPALSGTSSRRSKRSSSGSSSRSRSRSRKSRGSHRRQGTFPGAYSQRNMSEMDHQRPPADPVYTFMIKTIAGKGFKFMSTTEIAFCAMRMYSHFKRTEGNYKRLSVMKNAENVPPVYEIIWICDAKYEQLAQGQSRFFSTGKGTDAEQEKSLLACLLALSWDDSNSSRRTLQRALSPFKASRVPTPEDMFWDDFKECTDALSGDDQMVVLARVILLIAQSANKPPSDMVPESPLKPGKDRDGGATVGANENGVEYGDIIKALSATHLRDVGISLKTSRPGWQEAHVQLVSVLLVIAFLEEGAKNAPPGVERPDPISSLDWVGILTPDSLDGFLVEKLEARRALVELDLEPSGLVIKHDDEGEVERVEPALGEKKETFTGGSWLGPRDREYQRILPRSSDRKSSRSRRNRRRDKSSESLESKKSHSPVVITTISRNKSGLGDRAGGSGDTASGAAAGVGRSSSQGIRTIAQQRSSSQRGGGGGGESVAETPKSKTTSLPNPNFSGERGAGGEGYRASSPHLTISAVEMPASGTSEEEEDDSDLTDGVHISPSGGSADHRSETSSIVTRVYAPSSCTEDQVAFSRAGTSWVVEDSSHGQQSPLYSGMSQSSAASPHGVGMSQASVAGSRMSSPPPGTLADMQRTSERSVATGLSQVTAAASKLGNVIGNVFGSVGGMHPRTSDHSAYAITRGVDTVSGSRPSAADDSVGLSQDDITASELPARERSPSGFSVAAESETAFSEAASRFDAPGYHPASSVQHRPPTRVGNRLGIDTSSPNSAAGSRFEGSPSSHATTMSRIAGGSSPSGIVHGRVRDPGPMTGRSVASSMRSTGSSFFQPSSSKSHRSGDSGTRVSSAASASSWDEEDLQNMGTRWLSERAYNQQFDAHSHK